MKILTHIIKVVLSILLVIAISLLIFLKIFNSTILNKNYVLEQLSETKYYSNLKKEVQSSFENYIAQSGLEENVIENIVSEEKIKNDTNIILSNIYEGKNEIIDTTEIEENLKSNITKSLGDTKLNITQQNAINMYVETICEQYKETMSHTKYETKINDIINNINNYMETIEQYTIIAIIIIATIIIVINCKKILRGLAQIGIALTSTGMLFIILNIFLNTKIKVQNILILNETLSTTIRQIANDILNIFIRNGIVIFIFGISLIVLSNIIYKKKEEI